MLRRLGFLVRRDERRQVAAAFVFLMSFVGSHAVLETARDALFLARIPATHLPFVYVAIACLSFVIARLQARFALGSPRKEMAAWTAIGGAGSIAFGLALPAMGVSGLYALYVWPGVVSTLTLVHFWSLIGGLFTATQAKRLFGIVSLGSMVGAVAGSGGMTVALQFASPQTLVVAAGLAFVVSALVPLVFFRDEVSASVVAPDRGGERATSLTEYWYVVRGPYVRRLVAIAAVASATLTFADFVFKATVVDALPPERLAEALSLIYTALNALSLAVQLAGVGLVLRKLAPPVVLAILPLLLTVSGAGVALTGVLAAALVVKGSDGALRYSLHKTALELLVVPLSDSARRTAKGAMEVVGQRGGQVLASAAILAATSLGSGPWLAWLLAASAAAWALLSVRLRSHYVEQFRSPVTARSTTRLVHAPKLDVASLETLVAALDSAMIDDVLAALVVLEREKKAHLVPTLILYHPEEEVVVAALRLFSRTKRRAAVSAIDAHLLKAPSPRLRAEAYGARAAIVPERAFLERAWESEELPGARAAIAAVLASEGGRGSRALLQEALEGASPATRVVVCEVLGWRRAEQLDDVVVRLADDADLDVRKAAVHALGDLATPRAVGALVTLLGEEVLQRSVRAALARTGEVGFAALAEALADPTRAAAARWAVPRALALLDPERAAPLLLENLRKEPDGMVRFRSIVTLGHVVERHPRLRLDRRLIDHEIRVNVARAYRYLDRRLILEAGAREDPLRKTPGHELLVTLLRDKHRSAIGRVFRLLSLAFPEHRFVDIYLAIESGERGYRAGAVELTHNLLDSPLREAVVSLVDDIDDEARLHAAPAYHAPSERGYEALVGELLRSSSAIVRDIAAFHVAELGAVTLIDRLEELTRSGKGSGDVERALSILDGAPPPSVGLSGNPRLADAG